MRSIVVATAVAGVLILGAQPAFAAKHTKPPASTGYDISWPQCGGAYPSRAAFGIVGVNDGRPFNDNACLASEYAWAAAAPQPAAFYMNMADPGTLSTHWTEPGPRACSGAADDLGCAYNYGYNAAAHAFAYTLAQTGTAAGHPWWVDVETGNTWSSNLNANTAVVQGAIEYSATQGVTLGIYSTAYQWNAITGSPAGFASQPNWVAGASTASTASSWCSGHSFTGGRVALVQFPSGSYDGDVAC